MLFEVHDILLHRLWKWRKAKYDAFMKTTFGAELFSLFCLTKDIANYKRLRFWEQLTRRWYFNHHPKLSNSMIPYVRVFNGLPW